MADKKFQIPIGGTITFGSTAKGWMWVTGALSATIIVLAIGIASALKRGAGRKRK